MMIRNLFYNCYASKNDSFVWEDNVKRLCSYGNIFNGRKVVVIKTGADLVAPEKVEQAFSLPEIQFVTWPNGPLHELEGFMETLRTFYSLDPEEILFYAHTKGAGKIQREDLSPEHHIAIQQWRNRMYYECLSNPIRIDAALKDHSAAGCFYRNNPKIKTLHHWVFIGTFWWVKLDKLFSRQWENVQHKKDWPEEYLSSVIPADEVLSLCETFPHRYPLYLNLSIRYFCRCGYTETKRKMVGQTGGVRNCPCCGLSMIKKYEDMTI